MLPLAVAPEIPAGILETQLMVTPADGEEMLTGADVCPEQIVCDAEERITVGAGLTVIRKVLGVPGHAP